MPELKLVQPQQQEARQPYDFEKEMLDIIEHVDQFSWNRGTLGGLTFGDDLLDEAFNGLQPGIYLIAGQPNIGKSAYALQIAWQVANKNKDAYVLYFSLDDPDIAILPRIIASDQRIPIEAVKIPKRYEDNTIIMAKRSRGFANLRSAVDKFKLLDQKYGNTVEHIMRTVLSHRAKFQEYGLDKKICVFIDNLFDVDAELAVGDEQARLKYIMGELKKLYHDYLIPVISTAELKKLNGTRRPIMDDIRETIKTQYVASGIMLCYNEVKIKAERATIYHEVAGVEGKQPVFEVHVGKNKQGEMSGRIFYNMYPGYSFLQPVPKEAAQYYLARMTG